MNAVIETLPILVARGSARERGNAHGEAFRVMIADVIARWRDALAIRHGVEPDTYLRDFLTATNYQPSIERYVPGLLEEVRGIAEASGQTFETILAYNLMDEEWSYGSRRKAEQPGCTVACLAGGSGAPVVAQTMDIPSLHDGSQIVINHIPDNGPASVVFSGAGMIALNGANANGVGVVVNNLAMLPSNESGLPVMFIIRGILEQPSLAEAVAFCESVPHAIGQHYAIGGPDGIAGLEGAGNGVVRTDTSGMRYVHANHPLANLAVDDSAESYYAGSRTFIRHERAVELIAAAVDQTGIEAVLMDNFAPISCEPRRGYMTFGATSISCSVPPVVRVTPGPPHRAPWVQAPFSA